MEGIRHIVAALIVEPGVLAELDLPQAIEIALIKVLGQSSQGRYLSL